MSQFRSLLPVFVHLLSVVLSCYGQGIRNDDLRECVRFTHSYCNKFNYSTAIFPNPRGHETPEEAAVEFLDFNPLLINDCHPKLGTLLCFIYFPVCNEANFNPLIPLVDGFYPCQELCEEVHDSECTDLVVRSRAGKWAQHLQCNFTDKATRRRYYKPANDAFPLPTNCVNGPAPKFGAPGPEPPANECASGSHDCHVNADCIDTENSYSCLCRDGFTGDGKTTCEDIDECTTGSHNCSANAQCTNIVGSYNCTCSSGYSSSKNGNNCEDVDECSKGIHDCHEHAECTNTAGSYRCTCTDGFTGDGKECAQVATEPPIITTTTTTPTCPEVGCTGTCKYRKNANANTFKRNCFCYAAHVRLNSSYEEDCNHVYLVTVLEQFDLKTPYNSTHATSAPTLAPGEQITVIANPSQCRDKCPPLTNENNDDEYLIAGSYSRSNGNILWHLEGTENKALASRWVDKYSKRLSKWVQASNGDRLKDSLCHRQCE